MEISAEVQSLFDTLVVTRRALHAMPELSEQEFKTSDYIAARLKALGIRFRRIHTGLVADVKGAESGHTVGYRADIDGLPIAEKSGEPFAAKENMHACGHDGHTAMLLALAELLTRYRPLYDARLIFQFGEEGSGGAEKMIEAGALDGVDEIYAFHLCPELDKGRLASADGPLFAGTVEFDVAFAGLAAHCAARAQGRDALLAAVSFVSRLPEMNAAFSSNTLAHAGRIEAGTARNIVADRALVECTYRFFDPVHMEAGMMNAERILTDISAATGVSHALTVRAVYDPLIVDGRALRRVKEVVNVEPCAPRFTSEDFSAYCKRVPGCLVWLGIRDEKYGAPLHADTFGFDEQALLYGVETFYRLSRARNRFIGAGKQ